jgi:hypothetical protein
VADGGEDDVDAVLKVVRQRLGGAEQKSDHLFGYGMGLFLLSHWTLLRIIGVEFWTLK